MLFMESLSVQQISFEIVQQELDKASLLSLQWEREEQTLPVLIKSTCSVMTQRTVSYEMLLEHEKFRHGGYTKWTIGVLFPAGTLPLPDRLWGPPSPISNGYAGLYLWG
jgi:hypothetical protein